MDHPGFLQNVKSPNLTLNKMNYAGFIEQESSPDQVSLVDASSSYQCILFLHLRPSVVNSMPDTSSVFLVTFKISFTLHALYILLARHNIIGSTQISLSNNKRKMTLGIRAILFCFEVSINSYSEKNRPL